MQKVEIKKKILECGTDEEIIEFVKDRLSILENESHEEFVGQGYTDIYNGFISSKVHYKAAAKFGDIDCPDLVYDDIEPYVLLVKEVIKKGNYNEMTLFTDIFFLIHSYLPNDGDIGAERFFVYNSHLNDEKISIKEIIKNSCAFCSENAGLSHNLFKFLGIDSSLVVGTRGRDNHAYNLIFPNEYDNKPVVVYDPSHHIDYTNEQNKKYSFGFYRVLTEDEYSHIKDGECIVLDTERSSKNIERTYGGNGALDGYKINIERPVYGIGLHKDRRDGTFEHTDR